ncbi:MAG TPA: glycosaminoglycan attachment protein [Candidatus Desulfofervidus auxilii]|uniref:Glycosaminoglycan attachment protein n=1 Tax=Desulfofervidus auxilii TaxID=1621989 RepID=A0A7C0Y3J1_DESA2|nr:glycosaminoglycan attachment protein [Candidatus Desulfofervidus auxilii]
MEVKRIDPKRFEIYVSLSRHPYAFYFCKEIAWYSNIEESILGVVVLDLTDYDYAAIVLGKDSNGIFRAIDYQVNFDTIEKAIAWLFRMIKWYSFVEKQKNSSTSCNKKKKSINLFKPIIPPVKQHPYFIILNRDPAFLPAKTIINLLMPHFQDIDGNFVRDFQSAGFDSRIWELFLFMYFNEENLIIKREHHAPDFIVEKFNKCVAIEATTVGRKESKPKIIMDFQEMVSKLNSINPLNIRRKLQNEMPIKFGSPLYSKLKKKYWELDQVKGKPFVLAIADFHDDLSMVWSVSALIRYLYGIEYFFYYNTDGQLVLVPKKIKFHKHGTKTIPSGFFFQPGTEHISAVLFSSSGTISKFNRMGRQAGFKVDNIIMYRVGTCYNHNPNAWLPKKFAYIVDESCCETWAEGISMFHNPNALYPVPKELFPSIAHHFFDGKKIISEIPEFFPFSSITFYFKIKKRQGG